MSIRKREVKVHQVPQTLTVSVQRSFLLNLQQCAEAERPRFVLDCSMIGDMNYALINLIAFLLRSGDEMQRRRQARRAESDCNGSIPGRRIRPYF